MSKKKKKEIVEDVVATVETTVESVPQAVVETEVETIVEPTYDELKAKCELLAEVKQERELIAKIVRYYIAGVSVIILAAVFWITYVLTLVDKFN